jgi:uncharacterized protein YecT (DUF1311 family)
MKMMMIRRSAWVGLFLAVTVSAMLLLGGVCLRAAEDAVNPQSGHLIECGADKVVLFSLPTSPDGRYAVGWTLRAKSKDAKAVDWSKWKPGMFANAFLEEYEFVDPEIAGGGLAPLMDAAKSAPPASASASASAPAGRRAPYELLDGVVDLKKKTFLPLHSAWPYWPDQNHGQLNVAWSGRHAVIINDARFFTMNVWLITMDGTGMRQLDLCDRLNKEVNSILKAKRPLIFPSYGLTYQTISDLGDVKFSKSTVEVPFSADIPKHDYKPVYGAVSVDLGSGKVVKSRCPMKRDDPFLDNPALAKADNALKATYQRLLRKLDKTGRAALAQEQRAWRVGRDYGSPSDNESDLSASVLLFDSDNALSPVPESGTEEEYDAFNKARDASLIKSTKERTRELAERAAGE